MSGRPLPPGTRNNMVHLILPPARPEDSPLETRSSHRAAEFLGRLGSVINVSSAEVAEAVKLFANSQRDVLFGLANEYALICEQLGLDLYEIAEAGSVDYPRSGLSRPGPVGGQCLPKDTYLLASSLTPARSSGVVLAARHVNESVIARIGQTVAAHLAGVREAPAIALLGVAFKGAPITDDIRGSAALALRDFVADKWPAATFRAWDAAVDFGVLSGLGLVPYDDVLAAVAGADVVVVANDHPEFRRLPVEKVASLVRQPALIYDMCGVLQRAAVLPAGVSVRTFGVGVPEGSVR